MVEGIVLKHIKYKESSQIIYIYTSNGLKSVLVHGGSKLKSPYLNLVRVFSYVRLFVSGKDLKTLRDGETVRHFDKISKDIEMYTYTSHLMELIYHFANHNHDHEKLLQFLLKILDKIETSKDYIVYIMMVELKLLYLLGVQPFLKQCVLCGETDKLSFSIKDGGMICPLHVNNNAFKASTIVLLKTLYYFNLENGQNISFNQEDLVELRLVIDQYYLYHLNFQSKSRQLIKEMFFY